MSKDEAIERELLKDDPSRVRTQGVRVDLVAAVLHEKPTEPGVEGDGEPLSRVWFSARVGAVELVEVHRRE